MSEKEVKLHETFDGHVWAKEFSKTAIKLGYSEMDEGWLIAWFCNAVMAGYDFALKQERMKDLEPKP